MNEFAGAASKGGAKMTVLGIVMMALGILAMLSPLIVGISVIRVIGILVIIGGLTRLYWSIRSENREVLTMVIGLLTLACGVAIVANPAFGAGVLAIILATYFVVDGILEIVASFRLRQSTGWGFLLFSGVVSLILGVLVWRQFPLSGAWVIGVLIGIKLFLAGFIMITVGSTVRSLGKGISGV